MGATKEGLSAGYSDGIEGLSRKPKPPLSISIILPSFMHAYMTAYNKGYRAGQRDYEHKEIQRQRDLLKNRQNQYQRHQQNRTPQR